jgi:DNA-directed RNA polymerase subunit RPC12/RpoP
MMSKQGEALIRIKERSGKWKFRCGECGTENYFDSVELRGRASRPRCTACGSYRLDRVADRAKKGEA